MADTSYLRRVVEPYLLYWAGDRLKTQLEPRREYIGKNSGGGLVHFAFDGVSQDGSVGVCISASRSYKTGQMRKLFLDATLLNRCPRFKRRVMVFVEKHVWEGFKNQCDGMVDLRRIEPLVCTDLPPGMRARIEQIYSASAKEVGDRSGRGTKTPGKRK
jgi:hypothetical protein